MPTPYVSPDPWTMRVSNVWAGVRVVNVRRTVSERPAASTPVAVTR